MLEKKSRFPVRCARRTGQKIDCCVNRCKQQIIENYENLNYAAVIRTTAALADEANRYVEQNQPWATVKTDLEKTRTTLTAT